MAAEGLIITSPPPHPLYIQSHLDMGFAEVPDVKHTYYDGVTPTSTFVLDTRGNKWNDLIDLLLKRTGISDDDANPPLPQPESDIEIRKDTAILKGLTERERETAELALQGLSNAQIGAELFISEITVKKHLHSVYEKLNIRNRKELLRLFISR
jgi:DNA-binding CsgD family transcriptional regulator